MPKIEDIPKIEEKSKDELDEIIRVVRSSVLPQHIKDFIIKCVEMALWFPHILQKKNISLNRLRKMLFGKGHKSKNQDKKKDNGQSNETQNTAPEDNSASKSKTGVIEQTVNTLALASTDSPEKKGKNPGHGRIPHTSYEASHEIILKIEGLKVGDPCPEECGGKLYEFNPEKPRVLIRIKGQNFADIHKYTVEQLRCNLCGYLVQAEIPLEIGNDKYDAPFKSWLVLQKYFVAVPFYRQEAFQRMLNFRLPTSTQWDLIEQAAGHCYLIFDLLKTYAANGKRIHNDDTSVRILQIIQEIKNNPDTKRKGMFTSGFIAEYEGHRIALFLNGSKHAGENLADILKRREKEKPPIIQMCDALNCNVAKGIETILSNCLSHGFRKFQDIVDYFPVPCVTIMKLLSQVYEFDEKTKEMDDEKRLVYHQHNSSPVMELLQSYMQALFDEKLVEPNSELGNAMRYMQKHWPKLTRFLSVPGAPICNNVVERALKIAIRNRKSALFYRTPYSANIGGMLTSIIYTCHLAEENPLHYLTALQHYPDEVRQNPENWLPWNYKQALKKNTLQHVSGAAASKAAAPVIALGALAAE